MARVLIIDDERHNRDLFSVMLEFEGHVLLKATNGEEGLASAERDAPDLILLDVMMAGVDGFALATALKGNPATARIPIIIVTALDDRNARMAALNAGADDFLSKPVDRTELRSRARNLLRLKTLSDVRERSAHGIRASMDTVIEQTDLLLAGDVSDAQRERLHIVKVSAESSRSVANEMLATSKGDA